MSKHFRFAIFHWYLVPLVALVVWTGMLIAMLACWAGQGHPYYHFMYPANQYVVYISDIGATNLQPLFISCTGFQAIFFTATLAVEHYLRCTGRLQGYISKKQPVFVWISIVCAGIAQLGILMVSIFNTNAFHPVHISMLVVFICFGLVACGFSFFNSLTFGLFPQRLDNDQKVIFGSNKWMNLYMVSSAAKILWMIIIGVVAICFGAFMAQDKNDLSACFEWTAAFVYGIILILWSIDMFPAAIRHYKRTHPHEFDDESYEKDEEPSISTYDAATAVHENASLPNSPVRNYEVVHPIR